MSPFSSIYSHVRIVNEEDYFPTHTSTQATKTTKHNSWHVQFVATFASPTFRIILGGDRSSGWHRHVDRLARRAIVAL